jgi:phage tail-like protein
MDVQGSRYHLLNGVADWGGCTDTTSGLTLAELWADAADGLPLSIRTAWEYDPELGVLRLRRDTPLFRRAGRNLAVDPASRRGASRDGYGNWYWVDTDRRAIRWRPTDDQTASTWWSADELNTSCAAQPAGGETFAGRPPLPPGDLLLQGLTVTSRHYLLAGYVAESEAGLLVFDLQAGGAPLRLLWPHDEPFTPWDLADTADGGALVLDRVHSRYWRLDERLRLRGQQPSRPALFQPVTGGPQVRFTGPARPTPLRLVGADPQAPLNPISIEPGPDGSVLVLDADPARGYSTLYRFDGDELRWQTPMRDIVEVIDPRDPTNTSILYSLLGHDFCYLAGPPATGPLPPPMLYVADAEGDQVVAFTLDPDTGNMLPRDDFLPLRRWAGRALVRAGDGAWYDFGERFVPLQVLTECRFASEAALTTPIEFGAGGSLPGVAGESFDSQRPGCVWHRLLIDAQVPTGARLSIRARASDDPALLPLERWLPQPVPYLRSDGPELPWLDVWADRRDGAGDLPAGTGTYELLLQQVAGRYLQLEVTVSGGGRSTPLLRSLRAWFPRFSYPERYLPVVYAEHDLPGRFLERFLANMEGFFTAIEERIEHSHLLLDPRTAPAPDLPWLAAWFGLALDPQWDEGRRRFLIRHVDRFYRLRGTVPGLVAALRVYLDGTVDERAFSCTGAGAASGVRLVERFLTRDTGGAAYGAPQTTLDPDPDARVRRTAHRFDVLVPLGLSPDQVAMVGRIVETSKPAHTSFTLRRYYELFVVGQARLGIDTEIGQAPTFSPMVTGRSGLASGYLGYDRPFDITDRIVSDRDRVGRLPPI